MRPTNRRVAAFAAAVALFAAPTAPAAEETRANPLVARLAAGRPALGVWTAATAAPRITKVLATSGADFIVADVEHDVYDFTSLRTFLLGVQDFGSRYATAQAAPPAVIVKLGHRAGWDGRFEVAETLKLGPVAGVWVPFVES